MNSNTESQDKYKCPHCGKTYKTQGCYINTYQMYENNLGNRINIDVIEPDTEQNAEPIGKYISKSKQEPKN